MTVFTGSDNDDSFAGTPTDDQATGNGGNDVLNGVDGADTLEGGDGDDIVSGGEGNDFLSSGTGIDSLDGGAGDDVLFFGADFGASDFAAGGDGPYDTLILQGDYSAGLTLSSANISSIYEVRVLDAENLDYGGQQPGADFNYKVTVLDSAVQPGEILRVSGWLDSSGTLWVDGSAVMTGHLWLDGGPGDDTLIGGAQGDALNGGQGHDWLEGGAGGDSYFNIEAIDTVVEYADGGIDKVWTALATCDLTGTYIEDIAGATSDQLLIGNQLANIIDGHLGADTMRGGLGNDTYFVDDAGDLVEENAASGTDEVRVSAASHVLAANVENLFGIGALDHSLTGNDLANIIDGGAGGDTMRGLGGDDSYFVNSGFDVVIEAADGGTDRVISSVSHGLAAEVENLTLVDAAINGTGNILDNILTGNTIANRLDGGLGADTMKGGLGDDTYIVDQVGDVVSELAGQGTDSVQSLISYTLSAALEHLTLTGSANINATGNIYANNLIGNSGVNILNGGAGADVMNGGLGNDTYIVDNSADQVFETSASGGFDVVEASASFVIGSNIERLVLTGASAINGAGNAQANTIFGNIAANILDGGAGADTMQGFGGNDTYVIDNVGDVAIEAAGGGNDTIRTAFNFTLAAEFENLTLTGTGNLNGTGNADVNLLVGNSGANQLDGGAGADTMQGNGGNDSYVVDNGLDKVIEAAAGGTDTVNSSITHQIAVNVENLVLTGVAAINGFGNSGANTLTGNEAANRLDGGAGADFMKGGLGDDIYVVDNAGDIVSELAGQGTDKVESAISYTLAAAVENLTLTGTGNLNGTGNQFANFLIGTSGGNRLDGGGGADTMNGGLGNDTYVVDNVGDVVIESSPAGGIDKVESSVSFVLGPTVENLTLTGAYGINGTGNASANAIIGNGAANILSGAAGDDALLGGAGNDILIGGIGNDTLDGESGADRFTFQDALTAANVDFIALFETGIDKIVLENAHFTGLAAGALPAGAFVIGTAAADAGDRIIYDDATGNLYFDSDGTGATAAILFARLDNAPAILSASDFLVI